MKTVAGVVFLVAFSALVSGCGQGPKVVQGTVVSYDKSSKNLVIKDECPPNSEIAISAEKAETGAENQPGDLVRAACREEGGKMVALRLMNLTRQKELGFLAKAGTRKKCK
jgi:type IV pilus biogenesis protein CpaD/CtpE